MSLFRTNPANRPTLADRPILSDQRGVAALELALLAPVLLVLMLAGYDLTLWIRTAFRLNETASNMAEVISQCPAINDPADITQFDINAQLIAGPADITTNISGAFIMSAVGYGSAAKPVVLWQRRMGNPIYASHIGASGAAASVGAYSLPVGEVLVVTEAFSGAQPWNLSRSFMPTIALPALYSSALFVGRSASAGGISTLTPSRTGTLACAS